MNGHCCCSESYLCPWCAPLDDATVDDVDIEAIAASLFWGGGL